MYDPQEMRHRVNLSACLLEIGDYLEAALHCRLAALLYPRDHLEFPKSSMSSSDSFPLMMMFVLWLCIVTLLISNSDCLLCKKVLDCEFLYNMQIFFYLFIFITSILLIVLLFSVCFIIAIIISSLLFELVVCSNSLRKALDERVSVTFGWDFHFQRTGLLKNRKRVN